MLYLLRMSVPAGMEVRIYRFRAFPGFWKPGRQRKGEPITMLGFNDILGHEQIKEHMQAAIRDKKPFHAYLFQGEEGVGKEAGG